jgi:Putative prokaryotic signal transducing protein
VEIIEEDPRSNDDLVQIAFAETREEAALIRGLLREEGIRSLAKQASINGPMLGSGLLTSSPRRIYVRPGDAERARALIAGTMVEDPRAEEVPEPANAEYLADATGRRPRDYSVLGAYTRAWVVAGAVLAVAFVVFLIVH